MKKNKVVHLFLMDRFVYPYIETVNNHITESEHAYFLLGLNENQDEMKNVVNFNVLQRGKIFFLGSFFTLIRSLNNADKIIIHGLFSKLYILIIFFMPWIRARCHWVIWGGDLYSYNIKHGAVGRVKEFFKKLIVKDFGYLITYIREDVDNARSWYGATGHYEFCLSYPSNLYYDVLCDNSRINNDRSINVLVGNSADPSNNHIEIFEKLKLLPEQSFIIHCPLTYGDEIYKLNVIEAGLNMFGERFIPLVTSLEFSAYNDFLSKIDIAIFNHKRQQAMGNTIRLLGLGKKIYIRNDVAQWRFLSDLGFSMFDIENVDLKLLDSDSSKRNRAIASEFFSEKKFIDQLNKIFNK